MQEKLVFEYAVLRVVPRVEREEFINVGLILFCKKTGFLQARFTLHTQKLQALCGTVDCAAVEENLQALERISRGGSNTGPIGKLDAASRFRWLTATRSTIVQPSKVHPGLCTDPAQMLDKLFTELVL